MQKLIESSSKPLVAKGKYLTGPFATLGKKNKNGRIYPRSIYEDAFNEIVPKIQSNALLGECDHPLTYDEVRLSNVSHIIKDCKINNNGVVEGTVELLDTPAGKVVQSLVEAGVPIGISSRGLGDTKRTMDGDEVTNFKLITYDLVAEPSFSEAVLTETSKKGLSESLSQIESNLPLNESINDPTTTYVKKMIKSIRESLLAKTNRNEEFNINDIELTAVKELAESSVQLLNKRNDQIRRLREEVDTLKSEVTKLRESNKSKSTTLRNLQSNMGKLQDEYNRVCETTVPESRLRHLEDQLIETRKRLEVERRGMSYSQVGRILEGLTTSEEMAAKLDTLVDTGTRRRSLSSISEGEVKSIRESVNLSRQSAEGRRLSSIVSSV